MWRRYSHLLVAAWAASGANRVDADAAAVLELAGALAEESLAA